MKNKTLKKTFALFLCLVLTFSTVAIGVSAIDFTAPSDMYLISKTESKIAPGISESKVITNGKDGDSQVMGYAVQVDLSEGSKTGIIAGYNNYDGSTWAMQTVRDQAAKASKARGLNIVAAFNADIFNMSTGEPTGCLVMNGRPYKEGLGRPYFAILNDGTAEIGESMTADKVSNVKEAISGFYVLVKDGKRTSYGNSTGNFAPKTAVGIKADGSVIFYVADGRNYPVSCGLCDKDLASIMLGFGCVDVINLDGGGSTTYAAKYEGSTTLEVANNPSDGVERKVSSTVFVVSTAAASGVFDHASLSPNNDVYTPGSTVSFSAKGVDSSGAKANLPEDGAFALSDSSADMGTISANGEFTSTGKCGTVTVNYISGGNVCGETSIEIQNPDKISFSDEEVSLGFEKQSDLGLFVTYKDRVVNYKDGDFVWTMTDNSMGTFNGNIFTSSPDATVEGDITCTYAYDSSLSAKVHAIIGRLPKVVQDFEADNIEFGRVAFGANGGVEVWESDNSATCNMLTGHYRNGDGSSRGGKESAEIVDIDSGEPVRFGKQSLKLNYDFTNINGIEGACIGFTDAGTEIEGNPTGIGMWVYVPEGTPNLWLRIRLLDGSNSILTLDYTPQKEGLSWYGWKYVECSLEGSQGPFKLLAGETIRLMHTNGGANQMGDWLAGTVTTAGADENSVRVEKSACKGSIYIDNLQFVYGANTDDIDNPVVDSILTNNGMDEIKNGSVITSNTVDIQANFHDVENKYTSGIDYDVVKDFGLYVDGVNVCSNSSFVLTPGDDKLNVYGLKLADGEHSVKVLVRDKFGNETTETRYFTVKGEEGLTDISLYGDSSAVLGEKFNLFVNSNNISAINSVETQIKIGRDFATFDVEFNSDFDGSYTYNAKNQTVTLKAQRKDGEATSSENYIAKLIFDVPANLSSDAVFTYGVPYGSYTLITADTNANSFSFNTRRIPVAAYYTISADPMIVGKSGNIYVTDLEGNPASGVEVYYANGDEFGVSDENGAISGEALCNSVAAYSLYATHDGKISFIFSSQSVDAAGSNSGKPQYVNINAVKASAATKNISWLSNPIYSSDASIVKYAKASDYEEQGEAAFKTVEGTSEIRQLLGSSSISNNYAVRVNSAIVSGLKENTEYVYCVGDGTNFSDLNNFKTSLSGASTNFFVIGDTQAEDMTNIQNIVNSLKNSGVEYSFGAQTGDFVEKPTMFYDWKAILNVFSGDFIGSTDMVHVIGNHEQFSDDMEDLFAAALFNASSSTHYSVEYGNVYVAVINYTTDKALLEKEMKWLVEDASASSCQWKVVMTHQPPYGTNITANDTEEMRSFLPAACEKAGIDIVFSGHDHAYARTNPVLSKEDGTNVVDENGVVYYICGSTGEKSYSATNNPDYHFDVVDQDYNAIYLTVEATPDYLRIVTRESDGTAIDTYTKISDADCKTDGHTFLYDGEYLRCRTCGYATAVNTYTGFARDVDTGRKMYFLGGEKKIGWFQLGNEAYYFDADGLGLVGDHAIGEVKGTFHFDNDGRQIGAVFETFDGGIRAFRGSNTNVLVGWHEIEGELYYFSRSNGAMRTGYSTVTVRTGQKLDFVFSKDGKLQRGAFYETDEGTVYYWGSDMVGGWQKIEGETYYFDPSTHIMADDTTEIDGKLYAFDQDGTLVHEGAHEWINPVVVIKPNCTVDGQTRYTCSVCNHRKFESVAKTGHTDADGDGVCDSCRFSMDFDSDLNNFFYRVWQRILYVFRFIGTMLKNVFKK